MMRALLCLTAALVLSGCDNQAQDLRKAISMIATGQPQAGFLQLQNLAASGYPPGQFRLGMLYLEGEISPERLAKGEMWLALAADNGDVGGRYFHALLNVSGLQGGKQRSGAERAASVQAGLRQLEVLAEDGFVPAYSKLAELHDTGPDTLRDPSKAFVWYRSAAEQGDRAAIQRLVDAYQRGELGLAKDPEQAARWRSRLTLDPFGRQSAAGG